MNKVITVGREFGSGGRELGQKLAERLGIAYYDNEIVREIAKKTELMEKYIEEIVEKRPLTFIPLTVGRTFYIPDDYHASQSYSIFVEQSNVINEMAHKSDCVIVGRCADYILREMEPFRIFVYADMESKMKRCRARASEGEDLSDKKLMQKIKAVDKSRAQYYQFYTGLKWGDKLNYDMCANTLNTDIDIVVRAIARMFELNKG